MERVACWMFDEIYDKNVMIAGHTVAWEMEAAKDLYLMMIERNVVSWNSLLVGMLRMKMSRLLVSFLM